MLLSLRLTATAIPPSLSLFTLVTLDRAAYGQLKTKERMKNLFFSIHCKSVGSKTTLDHIDTDLFSKCLYSTEKRKFIGNTSACHS